LFFASILSSLSPGCRDQAEDKSDQSQPPSAAVESADQFAARAQAAMDGREFAKAGELYQRATSAPDSPDEPSSADQRFDWRCKGALGYWLAGEPDAAEAMCDPKSVPDGPAAQSRRNYLLEFSQAMGRYRKSGWPMDDPDRMVAVLGNLPALPRATSQPAGTQPDDRIDDSPPADPTEP
jgi:hypothetical protein